MKIAVLRTQVFGFLELMLYAPVLIFSDISGPDFIKTFFHATQLSISFIMLINVKMPTNVGILTYISMINTTPESLKPR